MKNKLWVLTVAAVLMFVPKVHAACLPTGFIVDGNDLTAALINPSNVSVPAVLNAAGCNIGIYYDFAAPSQQATLLAKEIKGADYYGVVVNADGGPVAVSILNNQIHNIGDSPVFTGAQHGVGLYLRSYNAFNVTGNVTGNVIYTYQKGGIVANGPGVKLTKLDNNLIVGQGHVTTIAQNGIQIGFGALPYPSEIGGNWSIGNSYVGTTGDASAGILIIGGPYYSCPAGPCPYTKNVLLGFNTALTQPLSNVAFNNDIGIFSFNLAADGVSTSPTPTNVIMVANIMSSDLAYNTAYIAAISDLGHTDYIVANYIVPGGGYGPSCSSYIDTSGSTAPQMFLNQPGTCTAMAAAAASAPAGGFRPSPSAP